MEAKIQEAIKSARAKNPGKILSAREVYEAIFKAGYDKALAQLADMTEECKQLGRKEVVEWVEEHTHRMNTNMYGISLDGEEWQTKLKEWDFDFIKKRV